MSRREMLRERQVAAPLMTQRAAHGTLRLAYRRFQPGEGVGIELAGLRLSGKPQRPSQRQFGHETPVLAFTLFAPAASRPGQHRAVWRQRGRQVAPCGHVSTVRQRLEQLSPAPVWLVLAAREVPLSGWAASVVPAKPHRRHRLRLRLQPRRRRGPLPRRGGRTARRVRGRCPGFSRSERCRQIDSNIIVCNLVLWL